MRTQADRVERSDSRLCRLRPANRAAASLERVYLRRQHWRSPRWRPAWWWPRSPGRRPRLVAHPPRAGTCRGQRPHPRRLYRTTRATRRRRARPVRTRFQHTRIHPGRREQARRAVDRRHRARAENAARRSARRNRIAQDGVRPLDQRQLASLARETSRLARLVEDLHTLSLSDRGALSYYHSEPLTSPKRRGVCAPAPEASEQGLKCASSTARTARWCSATRRGSAGVREPAPEQRALYRRAGYDRGRITARRERVTVDWEDSAPASPPTRRWSISRIACTGVEGLAQSGKRRFGARSGHREGAGRRPWRHARLTREPLGGVGVRLIFTLPVDSGADAHD